MPDFTYTALASSGAKSNGVISAGSDREAAAFLDAKGLFPIAISEKNTTGRSGFSIGGGVGGRELATMYGQMADLLQSGVPLLRALELLERSSTKKRLQAVIRDVRMNVAEGTGLAQSMAKHPKVFNELVVSMVRAGQEGGFLEDVLQRTANFVEHQEEMKGKIVGSMAYPAFLLMAGMGVLFVLIVFFVPRFEPVFEGLRAKGRLPPLTIGLMAVSNFMINYWWALILGFVGLVFGYAYWQKNPSGRRTMDLIRIRIPLFGKIFLNLALSRFCRILGTMLANGIPILKALGIA